MALTKNGRAIASNAALGVGSSQSGALDLTAAYGISGTARVTPAGTLTTGCTFLIEVATDGATWRKWSSQVSGLVSGAVYDFQFTLPAEIMHMRVTFSGHVGNAVAVECIGHELSGI